MRLLNIFGAATILLISCGTGNSAQNPQTTTTTTTTTTTPHAPANYDRSLSTKEVIDTVIIKSDATQTYALYLPSNYTPDKSFPCIYFFDAHARGALPVALYKSLAEQYGFVLIGSNVSRNGMQWSQTNEIVKALMDDSRTRINIDPKRIYTSGFSGGSRVASTIAIINGGVAGVIGCGAGFPGPADQVQNKFDYFGMAGVYDFNLPEMQQLDAALRQKGFTHQLLTFKGKHDWPPVADMQTAMLWIQACAMKEGTQPANTGLVNALKASDDNRMNTGAQSLPDEKALQEEAATEQQFQQQFTSLDVAAWTKKIHQLQQQAKTAKPLQKAQMYQRLINYLGFVCYMNSSHAINSGDFTNAENYLKIFGLADPENPDVDYLTAQCYMKKGDTNKAISALQSAVKAGYNDVPQITTDPAFINLFGDAAFKELIVSVRKNIFFGVN